ncbi:hypothetical protein Ddye_031591 [Dipteronia dyeriana]|uniref:Bifunctional inhibitor/plant lipid transfer protein/seed storage helical domain-containing protein n=1 Tax=Dipteronia dyeriana TaxID=168575 RepID=A0AAD9TJL6_9ROSI|nr:hypothetical protein Ddye_031591 [Dipteronia dyeriana]
MSTKKNINTSALLLCFVLLTSSGLTAAAPAAGGDDTAMQKECSEQLPKVMTCLDYAKGKAATPSAQCCGSVKDIKDNEPKCLCYIIQQAHGGSNDQLKSLGIQEAKLLQLPTACELKNASTSNCPKLLGISPSSPDAEIFSSNGSTTATPATPTGTSSASEKSDGTKFRSYLVGPTAVVALAVFFCAFPTGADSFMFYKRG